MQDPLKSTEFPSDEALLEAMPRRHAVRVYRDTPIPDDIASLFTSEINRINREHGFSFRLVRNERKAFSGFMARYGKFANVRNYFIISAPAGDVNSMLCGYYGERLVLAAQALGLNTCWVGLSYSRNSPVFDEPSGHKVRCVIAVGYGATEGATHRVKPLAQVCNASADSPKWFIDGVTSALMAPTALNQQKFYFMLGPDGSVSARTRFSFAGYTRIDLGIAVCHFNLAVPPEHRLDPANS